MQPLRSPRPQHSTASLPRCTAPPPRWAPVLSITLTTPPCPPSLAPSLPPYNVLLLQLSPRPSNSLPPCLSPSSLPPSLPPSVQLVSRVMSFVCPAFLVFFGEVATVLQKDKTVSESTLRMYHCFFPFCVPCFSCREVSVSPNDGEDTGGVVWVGGECWFPLLAAAAH